ncbi:MAG: hypothetical protein ACFFD1_01035 [Candidatus Thorarchaeota archaeon]
MTKQKITQTAINFGPAPAPEGQTSMFSAEEDEAMRPATIEIEMAETDQASPTPATGQMTMFDRQASFTEAAQAKAAKKQRKGW